VSSLLEELSKAHVRMPREYLEIASAWINRAKSELRRAMSMLSPDASAQQDERGRDHNTAGELWASIRG